MCILSSEPGFKEDEMSIKTNFVDNSKRAYLTEFLYCHCMHTTLIVPVQRNYTCRFLTRCSNTIIRIMLRIMLILSSTF